MYDGTDADALQLFGFKIKIEWSHLKKHSYEIGTTLHFILACSKQISYSSRSTGTLCNTLYAIAEKQR